MLGSQAVVCYARMVMPSYLELDPGEEIVLTRHRHPINLLPFAVSTALILVVMLYGAGWLAFNPQFLPEGIPLGLINTVLGVLGVLASAIFIFAVFIFLQNKIILTNQHYVQIDQHGLFNRSVNKLLLDQLQDVRGTRKGIFGTILGYGEVYIETAGKEPNFLFKPVADPLNLAETINDTRRNFRIT